MKHVWTSNQQPSYITFFPAIRPISPRRTPVSNGETRDGLYNGEGMNGYILEGNLDNTFTLKTGSPQSNHTNRTRRWTVNVGINLRMAKDSSSPVLPISIRIGIGHEKVLWDSHTRIRWRKKTLQFTSEKWMDSCQALTVFSYAFRAQHYSNGQYGSIFLDNQRTRNNYASGDFSTNYLSAMVYATRLRANRSMITGGLGYQRDGQFISPFDFFPEQTYRYGQNRVLTMLQYRFKPFNDLFSSGSYFCWKDTDTTGMPTYKVYAKQEASLRLELEYILGNMSLFPRDQKARLGGHVYLQWSKVHWRTLGFIVHLYAGRDYMNIRYDDIIFTAQAGITLSLDKYIPPLCKNLFLLPGQSVGTRNCEPDPTHQKVLIKRRP